MQYNSPALDPADPLGTDLALDSNGDLILTPQGDVATISGSENIKQMIRVRIQTIPDSYLFGADLGSQLGETIDQPLNPPNVKLIEQYVTNALSPDPRIVQINNITVQDPDDGSMQFWVTVNVTVIGQVNVQTTVPVGGGSGV